MSKVQLDPAFRDCPQVVLPVVNPAEATSFRLSNSTSALEFAIVTVMGLLMAPRR